MVCPYCGSKTHVSNSRRQKRNNQVWRRRSCQKCGAIFTSIESLSSATAYSVNRGELVEPFSADKLYTEILLALQDRKDCYSEARELTTTITQKVFKNAQKPLCEAQTISLAAADVLKRFDKRAYLRFTAEHPSLQA